MSPITTHILDTSRGCAAANVAITLSLYDAATGEWRPVRTAATDADGRCAGLLTPAEHAAVGGSGRYKLHFAVGEYFAGLQVPTIYPFVEVSGNGGSGA